MSNPVNARDMEELEGALLPVATEVVNQSDPNAYASTATVIPSVEAVFDYDTALRNEQQQEEEAVVVPDNANQLNYAGVSDDSKTTVGRAQQSGRIRSEEEKEAIRKANRKVYAQNYHEQNSIKSANERAKQRDREGLQIQNDRIAEQMALAKAKAKESKEQEQQSQASTGYQPKGYQIKDYDCGSYEIGTYEVTEYKSVYD